MIQALITPSHLHLALNHIPIIGLVVAWLPIVLGLFFRSRCALASGLVAVILCVGTMPLIMKTGEAAQESFVDGSIEQGLDPAGKSALHEHAFRAKLNLPVSYAAGILALLSLLVLIKFPRQAAWIAWLVLFTSFLSLLLSVWTAEAGGRIRHSEFRYGKISFPFSVRIEKSTPEPTPVAAPAAAPVQIVTPTPAPEASPVAMPAPSPVQMATPTPTPEASPSATPQSMPTPNPAATSAPTNAA